MSGFQIPERARVRYKPVAVEWPRGSGRYATYSHDEMEQHVAPLVDEGIDMPRGSPRRRAIARELANIHDMKHQFGIDWCASHRADMQFELLPNDEGGRSPLPSTS